MVVGRLRIEKGEVILVERKRPAKTQAGPFVPKREIPSAKGRRQLFGLNATKKRKRNLGSDDEIGDTKVCTFSHLHLTTRDVFFIARKAQSHPE